MSAVGVARLTIFFEPMLNTALVPPNVNVLSACVNVTLPLLKVITEVDASFISPVTVTSVPSNKKFVLHVSLPAVSS